MSLIRASYGSDSRTESFELFLSVVHARLCVLLSTRPTQAPPPKVRAQLVDRIHPTATANERIAKAVMQMMEQRKMRR